MIKKVQNHFSKFKQSHFILFAVFSLLFLDLMNSYYLRLYWKHKNLSLQYVEKIAANQGLDFYQLSQQSILEIKQVIDNGFYLFLFIILINNLFFYLSYLRKKIWAQGYVLFYTLTSSLLSLLFVAEGNVLGTSWFAYNIISIGIYLYFYFGIKLLNLKPLATLEDGKKEQ